MFFGLTSFKVFKILLEIRHIIILITQIIQVIFWMYYRKENRPKTENIAFVFSGLISIAKPNLNLCKFFLKISFIINGLLSKKIPWTIRFVRKN